MWKILDKFEYWLLDHPIAEMFIYCILYLVALIFGIWLGNTIANAIF